MKRFFQVLLLLGLAARATAADPADDLAIVVSKNNPVNGVSTAELQQIFRSEKLLWPEGGKITVTMLKSGHVERQIVLHDLLHMTEAEFNKYYLQAVFTGAIPSAPKAFATTAALRDFLNATPGALGYVRATDVDDSLKILKIDGRLPGENGYLLKLPAAR